MKSSLFFCWAGKAVLPEALRGVWLVDITSIYFESTRIDEDLAELKEAHSQALRDGTLPPKASLPSVLALVEKRVISLTFANNPRFV